jgi:hypothetical protein
MEHQRNPGPVLLRIGKLPGIRFASSGLRAQKIGSWGQVLKSKKVVVVRVKINNPVNEGHSPIFIN